MTKPCSYEPCSAVRAEGGDFVRAAIAWELAGTALLEEGDWSFSTALSSLVLFFSASFLPLFLTFPIELCLSQPTGFLTFTLVILSHILLRGSERVAVWGSVLARVSPQ